MGPSLSLFNPADFEFSIGVNDIWRYVKTDAVVCINGRSDFTPERLQVIDECEPSVFYSQIVNWDIKKGFQQIYLLSGYPDKFVQFDTKEFHKSFCSPFVAVQIAFKYYHAKEIHLFGIDLINHPHLDHDLCGKIHLHFKNLKTAFDEKGCVLVIHGSGILKDI